MKETNLLFCLIIAFPLIWWVLEATGGVVEEQPIIIENSEPLECFWTPEGGLSCAITESQARGQYGCTPFYRLEDRESIEFMRAYYGLDTPVNIDILPCNNNN